MPIATVVVMWPNTESRSVLPGRGSRTASTNCPKFARILHIRRAVDFHGIVIGCVAILDPLKSVAMHIIEPKIIGGMLTDGSRLALRPYRRTVDTDRVVLANVVAPWEPRYRAGPGGVFPFGIRWQTIGVPGLRAQISGICFCVTPLDLGHRLIVAITRSPVGKKRSTPGY